MNEIKHSMTTRWVKEDQYLRLIVEGQSCNLAGFKSALEIDLDSNILIDCMAMSNIESPVLEFLDAFSKSHKKKNFSIILAINAALSGLENLERTNTVSEARDLIFMEITERELGFFGTE